MKFPIRTAVSATLLLGLPLPAFGQGAGPQQLFTVAGQDSGDSVGAAIACLHSVTALGEFSVAVGNPSANGGRVDVYSSSGAGPIASATGSSIDYAFGAALAPMGSDSGLGDGHFDLIVGSPSFSSTSPSTAFVVSGPDLGTQFGLSDSMGFFTNLGQAVAAIGSDVDSDGRPEFAYGSTDGGMGGFIQIVDVGSSIPIRTVDSPSSSGQFGAAIAGVSDLNGNGHRDILVGAPADTLNQLGEGVVYAIDSLTGATLWSIGSGMEGDDMGRSLANLGDLDGNGFEDFIAGAPTSDNIGPGRAYVWFNNGASPPNIRCVLSGSVTGDNFGHAVALLGDVDGNGTVDFAVSAPGALSGSGQVFIYSFDQETGLCPLAYTLTGEPESSFGSSLAGAVKPGEMCDLNGDGTADFGVGSPIGFGRATFFVGSPIATPTPTPTPTATPTATPTPPLATPTPTISPPQPPTAARLTFRISRGGNLNIVHRFNRAPENLPRACRVALYGRTSRVDRTDVRPAFTISPFRRQTLQQVRYRGNRLRKAFCDTRGQPYLIHIVADTRCGSDRFFSNVFARQMACGREPPLQRAAWENQLKGGRVR